MNSLKKIRPAEWSILAAIVLLIAAISLPSLFRNRQRSQSAACVNRRLEWAAAAKMYTAKYGEPPEDTAVLVPGLLKKVPVCPAGGTYTPGATPEDAPVCSIKAHAI